MSFWETTPNDINQAFVAARSSGRSSKEFIDFAEAIYDYWPHLFKTMIEMDKRDRLRNNATRTD